MWTKKTDCELQKETRARVRQHWFAGVATVILVCSIAIPRPVLTVAIGARIFCALVCLAILAGWKSRVRWRRERESVQVCECCNAVDAIGADARCKCGGKYVSLSSMKWVETVALSLPVALARY
jgi:hypothetical protein